MLYNSLAIVPEWPELANQNAFSNPWAIGTVTLDIVRIGQTDLIV